MGKINVKKLKTGDVVEVETKNHIYTLEVISIFDAMRPMIRVTSNHPRFSEPKDFRLEGSTPEDSLLPIQVGEIVIGDRLFFTPTLWLSPTVSVKLNGV